MPGLALASTSKYKTREGLPLHTTKEIIGTTKSADEMLYMRLVRVSAGAAIAAAAP
jgi:hypothetical protein